MTHREYVYDAIRVVRVVDGDTVDLELARDLDLGFHVLVRASAVIRVRILGVDTPERGQPGWGEATAFTRQWLQDHPTLIARTSKGDAFGRWLATLHAPDGCDLSADLIRTGHAVPYSR